MPQLVISVDLLAGHTAEFRFFMLSQPPDDSQPGIPVTLSGIPAIRREADGSYPTSASLDVTQTLLSCVYTGTVLSPADTFRVGPYDPAVRTATGGYMAAALPPPPPLPATTVDWVATKTGASEITITAADASPLNWYADYPLLAGASTMNDPVTSTVSASDVVIALTNPVTVGDTFHYVGNPISAITSTVRVPSEGPFAVV